MKQIPDSFISHVICDLPFFKVSSEDWDNAWADEAEYLGWCEKIFIEYKRILKKNGNIFLFTGRQMNRKIACLLDQFFVEKRIIVWARKRGFNTTRGKALASGYEPICYYCNGEKGIFNNIKIQSISKRKEYVSGMLKDGVSLSDVWDDIPALPHNSKEKVGHPTQKPLKLIQRIVEMGSVEGDIILDNCAGSGTLAIACMDTGRDFILIEKRRDYYDETKKRIKSWKKT
jgi:site-specific DNA-methyltransferase (adenine-specific)